MQLRLLMFCVAIATGTSAPVRADVIGLPLSADRCAIFHALTGRVQAGCAQPDRAPARTRSFPADQEKGYFVLFDFDSNRLTPAATAHLQRLSDLLNGDLAGLCVRLVGHTDTVGPASYNMTLSMRRAQAARLYMAGPGQINATRLSVVGKGEKQPLPDVPNTDWRNRRVEILARESGGGSCS